MLTDVQDWHIKAVIGIVQQYSCPLNCSKRGGIMIPSTGAKVLTVNELSEYLRVHRSTIYRLLKRGQLPGFKIGSDWRFNVEAIDEWRLQQGAAQLEELRAEIGH